MDKLHQRSRTSTGLSLSSIPKRDPHFATTNYTHLLCKLGIAKKS